jgi:hypothetical protein
LKPIDYFVIMQAREGPAPIRSIDSMHQQRSGAYWLPGYQWEYKAEKARRDGDAGA